MGELCQWGHSFEVYALLASGLPTPCILDAMRRTAFSVLSFQWCFCLFTDLKALNPAGSELKPEIASQTNLTLDCWCLVLSTMMKINSHVWMNGIPYLDLVGGAVSERWLWVSWQRRADTDPGILTRHVVFQCKEWWACCCCACCLSYLNLLKLKHKQFNMFTSWSKDKLGHEAWHFYLDFSYWQWLKSF